MRSRRLALPPSLRMDAQLEMLTQEVLRYLLLVLPRYLGAVYLYLAQQDPRTMVLDNRTRSVGLKDLILQTSSHLSSPCGKGSRPTGMQ